MNKLAVDPKINILSITPDYWKAFWIAAHNCYFKGTIAELEGMFTEEKAQLLFKKIIRMKHESCLEHISFQISLEGVSRSFMAQITRHRHVTFHISSQHFQNHADFCYVLPDFVNPKNTEIFLGVMEYLNDAYCEIIKNGDKHYLAREVLPNATACKIIMSVNLRELRHIIKIRQGTENTPEMQKVIGLLRKQIIQLEPEFDYMLGGV
jgi:thymidylate synthase (FAD)